MRIPSDFEERLNAISHGMGALFGIGALIFLIAYNTNKTEYSLFSVILYGIAIILLFQRLRYIIPLKTKKRDIFSEL